MYNPLTWKKKNFTKGTTSFRKPNAESPLELSVMLSCSGWHDCGRLLGVVFVDTVYNAYSVCPKILHYRAPRAVGFESFLAVLIFFRWNGFPPIFLAHLVRYVHPPPPFFFFLQIFLTMRLDDDIDWTWAAVGSPLLVLMGLQLVGHLYEVCESCMKLGTSPYWKKKNECVKRMDI